MSQKKRGGEGENVFGGGASTVARCFTPRPPPLFLVHLVSTGASYVELEGGHLVTRERGPEFTALLRHVLASASACAKDPHRDLAPRRTPTPPPPDVAWIAAGMGAAAAAAPTAPVAVPGGKAAAAARDAWRSTSPTSALDAPRTPPRPLAVTATGGAVRSESACPLVDGRASA